MTTDQMRREAAGIAADHPDIRTEDTPVAPAVVVQIPGDLACRPVQIAVHHREWGVEVDYREKPDHAWVPLHFVGGSFEVRP